MKQDKEENAVFARNLKYYVELSGKEQKDICAALDIAEPSFSGYINGKNFPRLKTVQAIADYFGVTLADLIEKHDKNNDAEQRNMLQKEWDERFKGVLLSKEEVYELMDYAEYLISKRK